MVFSHNAKLPLYLRRALPQPIIVTLEDSKVLLIDTYDIVVVLNNTLTSKLLLLLVIRELCYVQFE